MNTLQRYMKIKNIRLRDISGPAGLDYTSVQKVIKGRRKSKHIRTAVAAFLEIPEQMLFGPKSSVYLRRLIEAEIIKATARKEAELKAFYLPNGTRIPARKRAVNA